MRLKFLLNTFALVLSAAGQTTDNNGLYTTWTALYVVGTVTSTITSVVPCPTSWTTTTQVITTTSCPMCNIQPPCQSSTTTVCEPTSSCEPTSTCELTWVLSMFTTTCVFTTICPWTTACSTVVTGCSDPPITTDYSGYTDPPQEQPYTTITSGTIVYVVMPSTGAAAGQVTNGVVQIVSAAERIRDNDSSLMMSGFALVVMILSLILM